MAGALATAASSSAEILAQAFRCLQAESPGLSVRSTAARLKITPSYWSKILRGEKPLTSRLLPRVAALLKLDELQIADLQRAILRGIEEGQMVSSTGLRTLPEEKSPVAGFANLGQREFWLLDQWYYIPLLNLLTIPQEGQSDEAIARRLVIPLAEARAALQRLTDGGFLTKTPSGYQRTNLHFRFPTDRSHASVRRHHHAMIKRAEAILLDETATESFGERLVSGVSFAGSSAKIKEARLILEDAMYRAASLMAGDPGLDEVFQLNVQVFPVTR